MPYPIARKVGIFATKTWQFFASVIVILVTFSSQFHDFKTSQVTLEVTAVSTASSQPVDLIKLPDLSGLKNIISTESNIETNGPSRLYLPEDIDRILIIYKNSIAASSLDIDTAEKKLGAAGYENNVDLEGYLSTVKDNLGAFRFNLRFFGIENTNKDPSELPIDKRIEKLKSEISAALKNKKELRDRMLAQYNDAEKQWADYKTIVMPSRAKLIITCAIGNQGSGATSLKPQALFRANLGEGNYLDFPMKMSGYDSSPEAATLQPQAYKVIKFESDEIQSMTAADRERFKSFLGNASPAKIFVSDISGKVYASNSVPFSPGVYEQKMFDTLKQFASSKAFR